MLRPTRCVPRWLEPVASAVPELDERDWTRLEAFEDSLRAVLVQPASGHLLDSDPAGRSRTLLGIRQHLAGLGFTTEPDTQGESEAVAGGRAELAQTLIQVVCGYYDLDLRDSVGLGHGRMISRHAGATVRQLWLPQLVSGKLVGIAMTEAHGGSRVMEITTRLVPAVRGGYVLVGQKSWISRLTEAAVWVVFARDPQGNLAAVVLDATSPGVSCEPRSPAGLSGWTWGELTFDGAPVAADHVLTAPGGGREIFTEHFAHYRPLVTAAALGAAAGVHDAVTTRLAHRERSGEITVTRDHALIATGRSCAQINAGLLACLHAQRLAATGKPLAEMWGQTSKAHGVDLARQAADDLIVLIGASGFQSEQPVQKARRDLDALRYADGMHDSLYRSAGRALLTSSPVTDSIPDSPPWTDADAGDSDDTRADHAG